MSQKQTAPRPSTRVAERHPISHPHGLGPVVALLAAPSMLLVGSLIHPEESPDGAEQLGIVAAESGRWATAHVLLIAGAIAMIFAVLVLGRLLDRAAPGWARTGSVLGVIGTASLVGLFAMEGFGAMALSGDSAGAAASYEKLAEGAMVFALVGLLLHVALIVLGLGVIRTHSAPAWTGVVLVLGAIAFVTAALTEVAPLFLVSQAALTAAMVAIAVSLRSGVDR